MFYMATNFIIKSRAKNVICQNSQNRIGIMCIDGKYCIRQTSPYIMLRGKIMAKGSIQNKLHMFDDKYT